MLYKFHYHDIVIMVLGRWSHAKSLDTYKKPSFSRITQFAGRIHSNLIDISVPFGGAFLMSKMGGIPRGMNVPNIIASYNNRVRHNKRVQDICSGRIVPGLSQSYTLPVSSHNQVTSCGPPIDVERRLMRQLKPMRAVLDCSRQPFTHTRLKPYESSSRESLTGLRGAAAETESMHATNRRPTNNNRTGLCYMPTTTAVTRRRGSSMRGPRSSQGFALA